jgi:glycosyltransferase involved in cell wall biosynthesis
MNSPKIAVVSPYLNADQNSTGYFWRYIWRSVSQGYPAAYEISLDHAVAPIWIRRRAVFRAGWEMLTSLIIVTRFLSRRRGPTILLSGTNPALVFIFFALIRRMVPFRWILVSFDVFPENLFSTGALQEKSAFGRILAYISRWSYRQADKVVVIGRDMGEIVARTKGVERSRIQYIPNGVNVSDISVIPKKDSRILSTVTRKNRFVFQFFGNLGRLQGIQNIINAIKLTKTENVEFMFWGEGTMVPEVQHLALTHSDRVSYCGPVDQDNRSEVLAACDVAIVSLNEGMYGLGVPSKSYFTMAADRPFILISDTDTEMHQFLRQYNVGWHCPPNSPRLLAELFDELASGRKEVPSAMTVRAIAESHCGIEQMLRSYENLLASEVGSLLYVKDRANVA